MTTTICTCRDCPSLCYTAKMGGFTLCVNCLDAGCTPVPVGKRVWPEEQNDYDCQKEVPVKRR